MCRLPKVVLVAPDDVRTELRRQLSSLEYDIVAAVASLEDADGITCDVAVLYEPGGDAVARARKHGLKTVSLGGDESADLHLGLDQAAALKSRLWELFRAT